MVTYSLFDKLITRTDQRRFQQAVACTRVTSSPRIKVALEYMNQFWF